MRIIFLLCAAMLITAIALAGKRTESNLRFAAAALDRALVRRDTILLNRLLSPQLQYGHSNGWIETKEELKAHLYNGRLLYKSIVLNGQEPKIVITRKTGLLREEATIDFLLDGKPMNMKFSILQVWIFRKGDWILLGRQSTKV